MFLGRVKHKLGLSQVITHVAGFLVFFFEINYSVLQNKPADFANVIIVFYQENIKPSMCCPFQLFLYVHFDLGYYR